MAGEKRQRCLARELVGDNLVSEPAPMSFSLASGGEEIRAAAYAYTPDLKAKVFQITVYAQLLVVVVFCGMPASQMMSCG
jgi:hypothetical protein